jgi:MFS family permease
MVIFCIGSLLCGTASVRVGSFSQSSLNCIWQTITWLIIARGIAGIGGGGIVSSVWIITSEIVEVDNRAKWSQALSVTWSCSAIAGPLLGGLFSSQSWSRFVTISSSNALDLIAAHSSTLSWRWGCEYRDLFCDAC